MTYLYEYMARKSPLRRTGSAGGIRIADFRNTSETCVGKKRHMRLEFVNDK